MASDEGSLSENWGKGSVPASWDHRYRPWARDVVTTGRSPYTMGTLQAAVLAISAAILLGTGFFVITWLFAVSPGLGLIAAGPALALYTAWIRAVLRPIG